MLKIYFFILAITAVGSLILSFFVGPPSDNSSMLGLIAVVLGLVILEVDRRLGVLESKKDDRGADDDINPTT